MPDDVHVPQHHRKRFFIPLFSRAEQLYGGLVCRIASEVKPAEPLDRDDAARADQRGKSRNCVAFLRRVTDEKCQFRPANGAGVRLRMETAVERIVVFTLAVGAL